MNILSIITITVVFLMTSYSIFLVNREKKKLTATAGMMTSMAIGVMSGLVSGYLIGVYSGDMFLTSGVGMMIGFFIGFLAGQPVGLLAILNGSLTGLLSGLMGAMLGVMLQLTTPAIMLGILLALFVVILGLVIVFILVETNEKLTLDTQGISPFAIISVGVVLVSLFLFLYSSDFVKTPSTNTVAQPQTTKKTELDVTGESAPKVMMKVTPTGYEPSVIHVNKGVPVELVIDNPLNNNSCLSTFEIPVFNIKNVELKMGTTHLSFTPDKTGTFTFSCGMQMYKGTIIVE